MKRIAFILFSVFVVNSVCAQVVDAEDKLRKKDIDTIVGWKKGGVFSFNFNQSSFTNWAAGGQNSIAGNGLVNLFANYKGESSTWDNTLDIGYGILKQNKNGAVVKVDDRIELNSKYGQQAHKSWYYAGLMNFRTHLTPCYDAPGSTTRISDLLAPAYLLAALGMDYKPNADLTVFLAPLTTKITYVNNQKLANAGAFGVEAAVLDTSGNVITPGENIRYELGGYLRAAYKKEVMKNVSLLTKVDLFSNYLNQPGNIDVNWEVLIAMKVNKYITATLNTQLIYDHDIIIGVDTNDDGVVDAFGPRTQFREIFGVGFSYKF